MKHFIIVNLLTLMIFLASKPAYTNEDCIESAEFPICLYPDKIIEFAVYRNGKEVGWHKVSFKKSNDLVIAEAQAYVEAPYLLIFDYVMEYHSISEWKNGKLINLKASLNDDGNKYKIKIYKNDDGTLTVEGKDEDIVIEKENILPTEHWHPEEKNSSQLINTLNGELVSVSSTKIDDNTWYLDGDIKYFIYYDNNSRWIGLKFNADEDNIVEYICTNCN